MAEEVWLQKFVYLFKTRHHGNDQNRDNKSKGKRLD
jgi:hypothetical protein